MNAVRAFDTANEMLVSHDMRRTILVHHFPREIIRAINAVDSDDGIAVAAVTLPRGVVNENDLLNTRLVKCERCGGPRGFDQGMIPENLSSVANIQRTHGKASFKYFSPLFYQIFPEKSREFSCRSILQRRENRAIMKKTQRKGGDADEKNCDTLSEKIERDSKARAGDALLRAS
jgi:hypothetical protein